MARLVDLWEEGCLLVQDLWVGLMVVDLLLVGLTMEVDHVVVDLLEHRQLKQQHQ